MGGGEERGDELVRGPCDFLGVWDVVQGLKCLSETTTMESSVWEDSQDGNWSENIDEESWLGDESTESCVKCRGIVGGSVVSVTGAVACDRVTRRDECDGTGGAVEGGEAQGLGTV